MGKRNTATVTPGGYRVRLWQSDAKDPDAIVPVREAEFYKRTGKYKQLQCTLCYRQCVLDNGEDGWCQYRGNRGGKMVLHGHGQIVHMALCMSGYQAYPLRTYKPGMPGIFVGGIRCSAGCTFCATGTPWMADRIKWVEKPRQQHPRGVRLEHKKSMVHPLDVIDTAMRYEAKHILFGINEATMAFEWTYDVVRLAQDAGLEIYLETNGFCGPEVVKKLAPYVNAVNVGIKGSADPEFYAKWMRSPGVVPTVMESAKAWREAGVHLIIGDVIAPPHMQSAEAAVESQTHLAEWIVDSLGQHTPMIQGTMHVPESSQNRGPAGGILVGKNADESTVLEVGMRLKRAYEIAHEAGLVYTHGNSEGSGDINCHSCGGLLLRFHGRCNTAPEFYTSECLMAPYRCPFWEHEQHVTDGKCDHCGADTPVVTLPQEELEDGRRVASSLLEHVPDGVLGTPPPAKDPNILSVLRGEAEPWE